MNTAPDSILPIKLDLIIFLQSQFELLENYPTSAYKFDHFVTIDI